MKKLKLLIAISVMMVLSVVMLVACNGETYSVSWTSPASLSVVASVGGETITSPEQVDEGSQVQFSWTVPSGYSGMRIVRDGVPVHIQNQIGPGTWTTAGITADQSFTFELIAIPYDCVHCEDVGCPECDELYHYDCRLCRDVLCPVCDPLYHFVCRPCRDMGCALCVLCFYGCEWGEDVVCGEICQTCGDVFRCNDCAPCALLLAQRLPHDFASLGLVSSVAVSGNQYVVTIPYYAIQYYQHVWGQSIGRVPAENSFVIVFHSIAAATAAATPNCTQVQNALIRGGNAFARWLVTNVVRLGAPGSMADPNNPQVSNPRFFFQMQDVVTALELQGIEVETALSPSAFMTLAWGGQQFMGEAAQFSAWIFACNDWAEAAMDMPFAFMEGTAPPLTVRFGNIVFGGNAGLIHFVRAFIDDEFCLVEGEGGCRCVGELVLISADVFLMDGIGFFEIRTPTNPFLVGGERLTRGEVITVEVEVRRGWVVSVYIGSNIHVFREGTHIVSTTVANYTVMIMFRSSIYVEFLALQFHGSGWMVEYRQSELAIEQTLAMMAMRDDEFVIAHHMSTPQVANRIKETILVDLGISDDTHIWVATYHTLIIWGTESAVREALLTLHVPEGLLGQYMTQVEFVEFEFTYLAEWVSFVWEIESVFVFPMWPEFFFPLSGHGPYYLYIAESFRVYLNNEMFYVTRAYTREGALRVATQMAIDDLIWSWELLVELCTCCEKIVFFGQCHDTVNQFRLRFPSRNIVITLDYINYLEDIFNALQECTEYVWSFAPFKLRGDIWNWGAFTPYYLEGFLAFEHVAGQWDAEIYIFKLNSPEIAYIFALEQVAVSDSYAAICDCCEQIVIFGFPILRFGQRVSPIAPFLSCVYFEQFGFRNIEIPFSAVGDWRFDWHGDVPFTRTNATIHIRGGFLTWRENNIPKKRASIVMEDLHHHGESIVLEWSWVADGFEAMPARVRVTQEWISMSLNTHLETEGLMYLAFFERFDWNPPVGICEDCWQEACLCAYICYECGRYPCACWMNEPGIPININTAGTPSGTQVVVLNRQAGSDMLTGIVPPGVTQLILQLIVPYGYRVIEVNINGTIFTHYGPNYINESMLEGRPDFIYLDLVGNETAINISLTVVAI
ncbi:MAG: hypothetical protein FWC11_00800 [Firmicutes bacterium]|nr:hypothetical protein [Bacillota bacterium]